MSYLYKLIFVGPDNKVYSGETYNKSTFDKWLNQCRRDGSPMLVASYEINSKTYPWYMQTKTSSGYKTRTW